MDNLYQEKVNKIDEMNIVISQVDVHLLQIFGKNGNEVVPVISKVFRIFRINDKIKLSVVIKV